MASREEIEEHISRELSRFIGEAIQFKEVDDVLIPKITRVIEETLKKYTGLELDELNIDPGGFSFTLKSINEQSRED